MGIKKVYSKKEMRNILIKNGYALSKKRGSSQFWKNEYTRHTIKLCWTKDNTYLSKVIKDIKRKEEF